MTSFGTGNPTALRVGMDGRIFGQDGRIVGRSVLKSGDGYKWNEYHLKLAGGKDEILVYESGVWKRFELFDPKMTMSANDASNYGVGDQVTIQGRIARVSYVGESNVAYIEGTAPEGYRIGSHANYFNAETLDQMFVVSWTGDEVEYYQGSKLARGEVERAFGLSKPSFLSGLFSGGSGGLDDWFQSNGNLIAGIVIAGVVFGLPILAGHHTRVATVEPPAPIEAPALHYPDGTQGVLDGRHFAIAGHQLNQISETAGTFGRHEYNLVDDQGGHALLVQGLSSSAHQWILFQALPTPLQLRSESGIYDVRPDQAAALPPGFVIWTGSEHATIRGLFLCRTLSSDGEVPPGVMPGLVRYGFVAQAMDGWVLARWSDKSIEFQMGHVVAAPAVREAFGQGVSTQ